MTLVKQPGRHPMQTYVQWDVRNWSRALDFWTTVCGADAFRGLEVLEVGSRDGGLSLWFAAQGAARVVCSDLHGPSEQARELHAQAGVSDRIEYADVDATAIPYESAFDIVVFKSVLGGIGGTGGVDAQAQAIRCMHRALKPGGRLLFAENLVASPLHTYLRKRFIPWGERWRYVTPAEMAGFLSPFDDIRERSLGFASAFGRTESQRSALGAADVALEKLVPASWRYIVTGVATKGA